jgi:glycosyltransferase involved in cell wall biosynthesis
MTVHTSVRHTLPVTDPRSAVLASVGGFLEGRAEAAADAVITLTPRLASRLLGDGVPRERLHVIPSGVERSVFAGPSPDPFPGTPHPRVVFVGRLHRQKQVDTLVRAAPLLRTPGVSVLVVGDGPDRAWLQELADPALVRFTGFVPHDEVPAVLRHSDVFVLPSRYEELGSVLLEAMHCGVPIVASDTGGIPDVITDGVTGRLVPPGDPAAVASAVDALLADRAAAARLGAAAQEAAGAYDWDVLADQVLRVYSSVVAAPRRNLSHPLPKVSGMT